MSDLSEYWMDACHCGAEALRQGETCTFDGVEHAVDNCVDRENPPRDPRYDACDYCGAIVNEPCRDNCKAPFCATPGTPEEGR